MAYQIFTIYIHYIVSECDAQLIFNLVIYNHIILIISIIYISEGSELTWAPAPVNQLFILTLVFMIMMMKRCQCWCVIQCVTASGTRSKGITTLSSQVPLLRYNRCHVTKQYIRFLCLKSVLVLTKYLHSKFLHQSLLIQVIKSHNESYMSELSRFVILAALPSSSQVVVKHAGGLFEVMLPDGQMIEFPNQQELEVITYICIKGDISLTSFKLK